MLARPPTPPTPPRYGSSDGLSVQSQRTGSYATDTMSVERKAIRMAILILDDAMLLECALTLVARSSTNRLVSSLLISTAQTELAAAGAST